MIPRDHCCRTRVRASLAMAAIFVGAILLDGSRAAAQQGPVPIDPAEIQSVLEGEEQPQAAAVSSPSSIDLLTLIWRGGAFMIPIGIMSLMVVALAFERFLTLRRCKIIPPLLVEDLEELADPIDRFNPVAIVAERNSMGEPLIEQLQRDGLPVQPFVTTNASKAVAIDGLALAFERGDISILNDPVLIGELQAYERDRLPSGMFRFSAPAGLHDDTVMALALAWYGATTTGPVTIMDNPFYA